MNMDQSNLTLFAFNRQRAAGKWILVYSSDCHLTTEFDSEFEDVSFKKRPNIVYRWLYLFFLVFFLGVISCDSSWLYGGFDDKGIFVLYRGIFCIGEKQF